MSQAMGPVLEHPVPAALAAIDTALDDSEDAQLWQLSDEAAMDAVAELHRLKCRLEAMQLRLVHDVEKRGAAAAAGAVSTKAWMRSRLRMHPGDAKRTVSSAKALHDDPAGPLIPFDDPDGDAAPRGLVGCREALAEGAISAEHVSVVVDALAALPAAVDNATLARAEVHLAGLSRAFDPQQVARLGKHLLHTLDPNCGDRLADEEQALVDRRELFVVPRREGGFNVKGQLDPELGAAFLSALSPYAAPLPQGDGGENSPGRDPRSPARRNADALADLIALAVSHPDVKTVHTAKPTIVVTTSFDTLTRQLGATGATLDWGGPLSGEAVRRLACDARIIPVVLGSNSEPLDVGRASYSTPIAIRRALEVRDGGCSFPGCERPPGWCHSHHCVHWSAPHNGDTALSNECLLCGTHHRLVHEGGWQVYTAANGLPAFIPPKWIDASQAPRTKRWRAELATLPNPPPDTS